MSLQDTVAEANDIVAELDKCIQHSPHVTADLDNVLMKTIRTRKQDLWLAVEAVKDAYTDVLKGAPATCSVDCQVLG